MGGSALVAYHRPDRLFDLRFSHWGATECRLTDEITTETPLARGQVDSERLADAVARDRILTEYLDPQGHDVLYLVSTSFGVDAYRVWWLGWSDGRSCGRGALIETAPGERDHHLRTWFRATKAVLADSIEMGVLSRRAAGAYLEARVCEDQDGHVYTYGTEDEGAGAGGSTDDRVGHWFGFDDPPDPDRSPYGDDR